MRRSLSDASLAELNSEWIGVEKSVYEDACRRALQIYDKREGFVSKTYSFNEISLANAHPTSNKN